MALPLSFKIEVDDLDKRLGGGIPKGSLVLIDGEHGTGKSVLVQRLAYGFLQNGYSVTFISTQLTTKDFISQMYSLGYDILKYLSKNKLLFISVFPLLGEHKKEDVFFKKLVETQELYKNDIIFIDTLSSIIRYSLDLGKIDDLIGFFKRLTGIGKTIFVTLGEGDLDSMIVGELVSSADIHITMKAKTFGEDIKHMLVINKYAGALQPYSTMTGFRIVPKIGFVIEIATVA
ncbi:MAG: ATPase domain-containing protein [Candidatus Micrarchaeia archaeon]